MARYVIVVQTDSPINLMIRLVGDIEKRINNADRSVQLISLEKVESEE